MYSLNLLVSDPAKIYKIYKLSIIIIILVYILQLVFKRASARLLAKQRDHKQITGTHIFPVGGNVYEQKILITEAVDPAGITLLLNHGFQVVMGTGYDEETLMKKHMTQTAYLQEMVILQSGF